MPPSPASEPPKVGLKREIPRSPALVRGRNAASDPASTPSLTAIASVTASTARPPVVALVTAYNEAETVAEVVRVLRETPGVDRVHVLDDASTDATADLARAAGAVVHTLPVRVPVGEAILRGVNTIEDEDTWLLLCDGDLRGLRVDHVSRILAPVLSGHADMSVGVKDSVPLTPWSATGATRWLGPRRASAVIGRVVSALERADLLLGGERVMRRSVFLEAHAAADAASGYGLVIVLNTFCRRNGLRVRSTFLEGCTHREKFQKWTLRDALPGLLRLIVQIPLARVRVALTPSALRRP